MKRTPVNPSEWGLQWSLNQGEVFEGITRHLHCSGQVALEPDAINNANALYQQNLISKVSVNDCIALALAQQESCTLLTGDARPQNPGPQNPGQITILDNIRELCALTPILSNSFSVGFRLSSTQPSTSYAVYRR